VLGTQEETTDTELLAIADTLVSLRAPPTAASYPRPQSAILPPTRVLITPQLADKMKLTDGMNSEV